VAAAKATAKVLRCRIWPYRRSGRRPVAPCPALPAPSCAWGGTDDPYGSSGTWLLGVAGRSRRLRLSSSRRPRPYRIQRCCAAGVTVHGPRPLRTAGLASLSKMTFAWADRGARAIQ